MFALLKVPKQKQFFMFVICKHFVMADFNVSYHNGNVYVVINLINTINARQITSIQIYFLWVLLKLVKVYIK